MKRHLFIDWEGVAEHRGVSRRMNPPEQLGPVVTQDRLWRSRLSGNFGQVMEINGKLMLWTSCGWGDSTQFPDAPRGFGLLYGKQRNVQRLESVDGLHWATPSLGVLECNSSRQNNLIYPDGFEGTLLYEPRAPGAQRWKYVHRVRNGLKTGVGLSVSPDGIHWKDTEYPVFPIAGDTQNVCFFDEGLGKFVMYFRSWTGAPGTETHGRFFPEPGEGCNERGVARVVFDSLEALGDIPYPEGNVIEPDDMDPENMDIYTNAVVKYPLADDVVLAFPSVYRKFTHTPDRYLGEGVLPHNNGILGTQLAVSRDGIHFERIREPYVMSDPVGSIAAASNYFHVGMVFRGDSILQYYWGGNYTHGGDARYAEPPLWHRNAVFAARQRIDGFCSMDFDAQCGSLLTDPFILPPGGLHVNAKAFAFGDLTVTLTDSGGKTLDAALREEATPLVGNYPDAEIYTADAIVPWAGKPVRLRVEGRSAKLYSYWFV